MSARPKTATAEAFSRAGYQSPRDRLDEIADEIIASESFITMDEARSEFYAKIGNDQALLWELFTPWHDTAATSLLNDARLRRSAVRKLSETKSAQSPNDEASSNSGTSRSSFSMKGASQRPVSFTAGGATTLRELERIRGHVAVLSALDTEQVNAQPIGKVSVNEARKWAAKHSVRCRFIELMTSNMPEHFIIGEHVTPEEANAFLEQARREAENV